MSQESAGPEPLRPDYRAWLRGPMALIAVVIVARFVLEAARVPKDITRFVSASVIGALILIYLGAVAPLRGITRVRQMVLPALVWSVWVTAWDTFSLILSATLRLPGSHFADAPGIFQNWGHVGMHVLSHLLLILPSALIVIGLMSLMVFLHRWPVAVAPSAVLGGLVVLRFAAEAMGFAPTTASAWSSTVGVLLGALFVGGVGPRVGLTSARQLLAPSLALGGVWRFWAFLARLVSATPIYRTHFFDPSQGRVAVRLLEYLGIDIVVGAIAGLLIWGIAYWTFCVLEPAREESQRQAEI